VDGQVSKPGEYTLEQIRALPRIQQNTRHVCVEGWDVIGSFGGARISALLAHAGADTQAPFLTFSCADDYYETLDMATALQLGGAAGNEIVEDYVKVLARDQRHRLSLRADLDEAESGRRAGTARSPGRPQEAD